MNIFIFLQNNLLIAQNLTQKNFMYTFLTVQYKSALYVL